MLATLLVVVHVFVCLVLILVILLQAGRGQGLTGPSFASGNVQSLLGTRAADFLTKATSVSAICFLFTCIGLNYIEAQKSRSLLEGVRRQNQPVDMEAVRKALEKIKAENGGKLPDVKTLQAKAGALPAVSGMPAVPAMPANSAASVVVPSAPAPPQANAAPAEKK